MPETIDAREEQQLLDAVKKAGDHVAAGMTPDAAVEKVARDSGFGPGKIRLMGQAYNTGQQLGQWRTGGTNILDKLASFDLCDPQKVIDNIYNGPSAQEKAAAVRVDPEYSRPPHWANKQERVKTASAPLPRSAPADYKPDPNEAVHKAFGSIQRAKQAADEGRRKSAAASDAVMSKVAQLVTYFKQASYNRLPFETVEHAVREYYGDAGVSLMNVVHARLGRGGEKRASDKPPVLKAPLNVRAEPFTLIKDAIDAAGTLNRLKKEASDLAAVATTANTEELRPFSKAGEAQQPAETGPWSKEAAALFQTKEAFFGPVPNIAIGGAFGRALGDLGAAKPTSELVDDEWMKLEDPEHENEMRKIKAHAMINQLMTDPDDPISGHDPDKVLSMYNEISQSTPRLAENIAMLRPMLRKRLEGHTEPFESKEQLDIEHGLSRTKMPTPNTSILGETPEKIMS